MSYLQNLRAAQAEINKAKAEEQAKLAEDQAKQQTQEGENLTKILNFLGFELKEPLSKSEYKVDGFTFYHQTLSTEYAYQPGYREEKNGTVSFRLVVAKDVPYNEEIEDFRWDCYDYIGSRDVDMSAVAVQTKYRAELANLLDHLNAQYESRLPEYQRALEQAQQRQEEGDFPHTFLFKHDGVPAHDKALSLWIDEGYRVIQMNTVISATEEIICTRVLLSKHPKIVPVTHTTHFHDEI